MFNAAGDCDEIKTPASWERLTGKVSLFLCAIYDAQDKLVSAQKTQPGSQQEINPQNAGIYMITVTTEDEQRSTQRVVVKEN